MMHGSKEEHDLYIQAMINNTANDEKTWIIDNCPQFHSWHEIYAILLEELQEAEEAMETLKHDLSIFWEATRRNWPSQQLASQIEKISFDATQVLHEALQVKAVALKALEPIKKAPQVGKPSDAVK